MLDYHNGATTILAGHKETFWAWLLLHTSIGIRKVMDVKPKFRKGVKI